MTDIDWARFRARDWLGAAATLFALAVTFNAEYEIAIAVHINPIVAYAVPGALDVYVLRALQVKRDVFLTVLAMVAVNAASHLVGAGVLAVSPALIVAVSAIAPLVLWRAHVLRHEASTKPRRWWRRSTVQAVPPVPEHVPAVPEAQMDTCDWCGYDNVPRGSMWLHQEHVCPKRFEHRDNVPGFEEHAAQAVDVASTGTVNVPEHDDMDQIARAWEGKHAVPDEWDGTVTDQVSAFPSPEDIVYPGEYEASTQARVLALVPPLPAGFEPVLEEGDKEFLMAATMLVKPTIRALKELGMGNDRARRIKQYLETENNGGTA